MAQYFFKMSQAEKNDILDKHKTIYDGYVTQYGQQPNTQPLYVQDFANDKGGITVNNKGEVKQYTNMNINEDIDRHDRIGDGPTDLKGGTVDLHGQSDDYKDRSMYDPYYSDDEGQDEDYENNSNDEVKKLISILLENNLVDKEYINVYKDHIEIYSINGCDSEYFMENFIRLYPEDIDNGVIRVNGEYYEEEIDEEEYQEVLDYIFETWEPLLGIEFVE